jgi:hypothetical protein
MRKGDWIALVSSIIGWIMVAIMVLPQAYPGTSLLWLWRILFWVSLAFALISSLFLIYGIIIRPRLTKGFKMIDLLMIIIGFLLIIGGTIHHFYDKRPSENKSPDKPISEITIPAPIPTQAPTPAPQKPLKPPPETIFPLPATNFSRESLQPRDIVNSINQAPLLQQSEIAKHYIGIKVHWEGELQSTFKHVGNVVWIYLNAKQPAGPSIKFQINPNDYPGLALLKRGAHIKVEGVIEEVKVTTAITLKDVKIISY